MYHNVLHHASRCANAMLQADAMVKKLCAKASAEELGAENRTPERFANENL